MSVGWILSIGKIREKLWTNQQPSLKRYVKCALQSENQQNQYRPSASFTFHVKKVKEALRTRLSGNKITWTETFVRSKKFIKWKTFLNRETVASLACYENLPIKTHHRKNLWSFLCITVTPFPLQISCFRSLHRLSSNNSKNTDHRHLPLTGTDHFNSRLFWKYCLLEKQSLISEL